MNWKSLFDSTILQRGYSYYLSGKFEIISRDSSGMFAIVNGREDYYVNILLKNDTPFSMECNCPYAAAGNNCKHMAAILYALTAGQPSLDQKPKKSSDYLTHSDSPSKRKKTKVLPILKISEREIQLYTTLNNYRNSHYRSSFLVDYKIVVTAENHYLIQAVHGFSDRSAQSLLVDSDFRINNFACTCHEFQSSANHRLCLHLNSLLYRVNNNCHPLQDLPFHEEFTDPEFPPLLPIPKGESIEQKKERLNAQRNAFQAQLAKNFFRQLESSNIPLFTIQNRTESGIDIACHLHYQDAMPFLSFQVVGDAAYKIKNISHFLERIRTCEYHRYGQKLAFQHTLDAFTPAARRIIATLMHDEDVALTASDSVYLQDLNLDSLYDIFSENPDLLFGMGLDETTQNLEFQIIPQEKNYYKLDYNKIFHHMALMQQYGYYFNEDTLIRVHCYDIAALHLLQSLTGLLRSEVIFDEHLYPQIADLVQRANGEITPENTYLRFKLDIEKRNIRILAEGNTDSLIAAAITDALQSGGATFKNNAYYFSGISQDILNQLVENLSLYGEVWVSDELKSYHRLYKAPKDISVRQSGNLLSIDIHSGEFDLKETIAILKSFRRKKEYHKLKNGETIKLDTESWQALSDFLENQGLALSALEKKETTLPMYQLLSLSAEPDIDIRFEPNLKEKLDYFHAHGSRNFPIPSVIEPILKPYQKEGFQFLKLLEALDFNGILADDMGLGKTLQTLTLLSEADKQTSLIICPASLIYNWRDEIHKFFPEMSSACVLGEKEERLAIWQNAADYQLIITSYDYLLRDIEDLTAIPFYYVVLDESQRIKNMQTKSAKAAKRLNSQHRLALSGTPIENNLAELWSVFDFLMPGYLYSYSRFRKKFEVPIIRNQDEAATQKLSSMVKPFVLRRLKKDVLDDLPEKFETILTVTPTEEEKRVYQAHESSIKNEVASLLQESGGDVGVEILALLTRLRLLCCDRSLIEDGISSSGSKVRECLKLIQDLNHRGHQILVFSSFTKVLDLLAFELRRTGIGHQILQGSTPKEKRHQLVNDFQNGGFPVFLISLKAGGTGLNLTGAQAVIHFDPWWNKAAMNQATDRAYRIGQKQSVEVYSLLMEHTIEERIFELQNKKWQLAEQLIGGESKALTGMSREEVMELFG